MSNEIIVLSFFQFFEAHLLYQAEYLSHFLLFRMIPMKFSLPWKQPNLVILKLDLEIPGRLECLQFWHHWNPVDYFDQQFQHPACTV